MAICEQSIQGNSPISTCFAADFLAKASRLQDGVSVSEIQEELSSLKLPESLQKNGLHFYSWKMSSACYRMTAAGHLIPSSPHLLKWGIISNGWCLTANTSESPNSEDGCILSDKTVRRAIKDLEKAGLIRKEYAKRKNGSFTSNRYFLL